MLPVASSWVPADWSARDGGEAFVGGEGLARSCGVVAATGRTSAGRLRKAMPRPTASRMGKTKIQKMASGSRRKRRKRTMVSCEAGELEDLVLAEAEFAVDYSSRRFLPVRRTKTSSRVAEWVRNSLRWRS